MDELGVTECTDPDCRAHGELVRLRAMREGLLDWCDQQDVLSKGESWTTHKIRRFTGKRGRWTS